jgi:hypothetical protein
MADTYHIVLYHWIFYPEQPESMTRLKMYSQNIPGMLQSKIDAPRNYSAENLEYALTHGLNFSISEPRVRYDRIRYRQLRALDLNRKRAKRMATVHYVEVIAEFPMVRAVEYKLRFC